MAKKEELHVDKDDYTKQDSAAKKKDGKTVEKSVKDTTDDGMEDSRSKAGSRMNFGVKAVLGYSVLSSLKTNRMVKKHEKDSLAYEREDSEARLHANGDKTCGDVFATAMTRIQLQQKQDKLKKLQRKIEKRRNLENKVGEMVFGVMQSVGSASKTSAMQGTMQKLTANTGGIGNRDIPTVGSPASSGNEMSL